MTSQARQQVITIHIVPNISRSKGNQKLKFVQLIQYDMKNIFLHHTECGGEASPRSFQKKSKLSISLNQQSEILYSLHLLYVQVEVYQHISKLRCWPPSHLYFEKQKEVWNCLPASLSAWVLKKKKFLTLYFINWPNCIVLLLLLLEVSCNMCIVIIWCPVCDFINFEINRSFLIKPFSTQPKIQENLTIGITFNMK